MKTALIPVNGGGFTGLRADDGEKSAVRNTELTGLVSF